MRPAGGGGCAKDGRFRRRVSTRSAGVLPSFADPGDRCAEIQCVREAAGSMPCPVSDSHHVGCRPSIAVVGSRAQTAVVAAPVGRLLSVVFECADPDEEGRFWEAMLGYARHHSGPDWVTIVDVVEQTQRLSFQRVEDHVQPTWPARDRPQQAHIDLLVEDLDNADGRAIALGARRLTDDAVVHEDESFRVYADPAGHPFCLIVQVTPDL